jgi:uncharacterized protein (DUF58 family)
MPQGIVDALDVALISRVHHSLLGDRRAAGIGAGTELSQLRPYVEGDDVRFLDPAATARTGEPHVRLHVPERALPTWVVLDVSPSMAFGTASRLKADVAEGAALVLGRLAVRRAGSIGLVRFGAGDVRVTPPRGSKPGLVALRRALAEGVGADGAGAGVGGTGSLGAALTRLGKLATRAGLIVIISDFRDQEHWVRPLGSLALRHTVLAIEVSDPRESEIPAAGMLSVVDPETGALHEIDTSSPRLRARFAEIERARREQLNAELRRLRVPRVPLSTGGDWLADLGRGLAA